MTITAAADGSALGNPGPAGWAWYVDDDAWAAGGWPHGTNNQGELMAVIDLLESTADEDDDLLILCDSQYVINAVTKWMPGWKRKGWRKADGSPVQNLDLLTRLDAALDGRRYRFEWVRGHTGHELNEAADSRARAAATAYQRGGAPDSGPGWAGGAPGLATAGGPATSAQDEPALFDDLALGESDEDAVLRLERALLDPRVREDVAEVGAIVHPEFVEFGSSGRILAKDDIALSPVPEDGTITEVISLDRITPTVILLTYRTADADGAGLRSSLWVRDGERWRLRFRQRTSES